MQETLQIIILIILTFICSPFIILAAIFCLASNTGADKMGGHAPGDFIEADPEYESRKELIRKILDLGNDLPNIDTYDSIPIEYHATKSVAQRRSYPFADPSVINTIRFLTKCDSDIVVYVGAAQTNHHLLFSALFPNKRFILIDPLPIVINDLPEQFSNILGRFVPSVMSSVIYYRFSDVRTMRFEPGWKTKDFTLPLPGTQYINAGGVCTSIMTTDDVRSAIDDMALSKKNNALAELKVPGRAIARVMRQIKADILADSLRRIYVIEDFMTSGYAETLRTHDVAFICAPFINSSKRFDGDAKIPYGTHGEIPLAPLLRYVDGRDLMYANDILVHMAQERLWVEIMRPRISMLSLHSLRFARDGPVPVANPYHKFIFDEWKAKYGSVPDEHMDWFDISCAYLSVFDVTVSSLIYPIVLREDIDRLAPIDQDKYARRLHGHCVLREFAFYDRNAEIFDADLCIDGCLDCNSFINTMRNYLRSGNVDNLPKSTLDAPVTIKKWIAYILSAMGHVACADGAVWRHGFSMKRLTFDEILQDDRFFSRDWRKKYSEMREVRR